MAALYIGAAVALAPASLAVLQGSQPEHSLSWVPSLGVSFSVRLDGLGVIFTYIALLIGAVVFAYSTRYLEKRNQLSFYLLMTVFTAAMVALVLADDLVVLFIAWEMTSIASFLLIARSGVAGEAASMRALLITFVGGIFLLIAVALVWTRTRTTSLSLVFSDPVWSNDPVFTSLIAVLIALAAFTKSAQFPFHVWLPDAMAAITPVSAYLHAAAVVKAGVFLLARFSPLFHATAIWNILLLGVGLITTCTGAWFALQQCDLKRLMAYSTVSQLGVIVATIGVGTEMALAAALIHTIAHALFKSGLFMLVGVIDHAVGTRDLRRMPPGLYKKIPVTFVVTTLGCASMAGIPPMMGFVSKESILLALSHTPGASWTGWAALGIAALGSVLTFSYCAKIVLGTFFDGTDSNHQVRHSDPLLLIFAAAPIVASVPLSFLIGRLDNVIGVAVQASTGAAIHPDLALWHGLTLELGVTITVIVAGIAVAAGRRQVFRWAEARPFPIGGAEVISGVTRALRFAGLALVRPFDAYHATRHLLPILGSLSLIGIGGTAVLVWDGLPARQPGLDRPIDAVLLLLISVAVVAVCSSRSRLAATISLSAVGILMTVQILALGAPDVALTQLLVESLSIIVIMLVLQRLPLTFPKVRPSRKYLTIVFSVVIGAGLAALTWALNGRREKSGIADYYLANTEKIAGGHNVVNIILVEFRALDTMGELAVLGMAGVAIIALLSTLRHRHLDPPGAEDRQAPRPELALNSDPDSAAYRAIHQPWPNAVGLQLMVRFLTPALLLISVVLFVRGHNSPGGGFIAALVASAVVGLVYLSTSKDRQIGPPRLPLALIGSGIMVAVLTGIADFLAKGSFLEPIHGHLLGVEFTSSMVFDIGVYLAVLGLIMVAFNVLGASSQADESVRERVDESVEGELEGPMDTVRGDRRVAMTTTFLADGQVPKEAGR